MTLKVSGSRLSRCGRCAPCGRQTAPQAHVASRSPRHIGVGFPQLADWRAWQTGGFLQPDYQTYPYWRSRACSPTAYRGTSGQDSHRRDYRSDAEPRGRQGLGRCLSPMTRDARNRYGLGDGVDHDQRMFLRPSISSRRQGHRSGQPLTRSVAHQIQRGYTEVAFPNSFRDAAPQGVTAPLRHFLAPKYSTNRATREGGRRP